MKKIIEYIENNILIVDSGISWRGLDADDLLSIIGERYCLKCGQKKNILVNGEYPCTECGLPTMHDAQIEAEDSQ